MMNQVHPMSGNTGIQTPTNEQQGRTVLFVSDLAENTNEADLENFFKDFKASILLIQINRVTKQVDRPTCNANIIFKDNQNADLARKALNLRKIKGRTVRIMWHERDTSVRYSNQGNIFIKNIPAEVSPRDFFEFFLQFGDIVSAKLCEDEEGNHYGYGYVHYTSNSFSNAALDYCANNQVWNQTLDVKDFQKKNERLNPITGNKNVYVKNIPLNVSEAEIKKIFCQYGGISWMKVVDEKQGKFAIISYDNEETTIKAIQGENNRKMGENQLFVDSLQRKSERKKLLSSKINDNNFRLNTQFRNCNLHIRNLPRDLKEENLGEIFGKYGEIHSIKIPKYTLVTKVNNEFKEYTMAKEFGYVCFTNEEAAKNAREGLSGRPLPGFESSKRPVIVDIFMPKNERQQVFSRIQQFNPNSSKKIPFINPAQPHFNFFNPNVNPNMNFNNMFGFHPNLARHIKFPQQAPPVVNSNMVRVINQKPAAQQLQYDEPDIKYMESLEDDGARKDYIGEFIFKRIESHDLIQRKQLPIDTIGKITGMILGIDDFNEIVEILKDYQQLTSRIQEALELLEDNPK